MTPEVYSLIYNFIADKLEEAGYSVERPGKKLKTSKASNSRPSGLDWSRSDPTSLFYFPCQARCADDSFFIEYMEGRYPLNPSTWIENTTVPLQPTLEPVEPDIQNVPCRMRRWFNRPYRHGVHRLRIQDEVT